MKCVAKKQNERACFFFSSFWERASQYWSSVRLAMAAAPAMNGPSEKFRKALHRSLCGNAVSENLIEPHVDAGPTRLQGVLG